MFEVVWDTKVFNKKDWPNDGTSPWVWSFGDATGYANHADYVFGWKGDSLQRILDTPCRFNCEESGLKVQSVEEMNKCRLERSVKEDIDSCEYLTPQRRREGGVDEELGVLTDYDL